MTGYQSKKLMAQSREDDLVKLLRAEDPECGLRHSIAMEAADRIEELQDEITYLRGFARKVRAVLGDKKD